MPPRMSCSMTVEGVNNRTKTVTRRDPTTWARLRPGDPLTLIEKGMGLAKGAHQVVLAEVVVVSNRLEPLGCVLTEPDATRAEGLPEMSGTEFMSFWLRSHGQHPDDIGWQVAGQVLCRRIEWRYP